VAKEIFEAGQTLLNGSFTLRREDQEGKKQIPFGNDNNKGKGKGNDKNKGKSNRRSLADPYGMTTKKGDGDRQAFSAGLQPAEVEHLGRCPRL
jgi:hypothetical protein